MHKALESVLKYFDVSNGKLCLAGKPVSQLVEHTDVPVYLYDLSVARKKYEKLRAAIPDEVEIHYAIKANPHAQIVNFFKELGCGADVASRTELEIALAAGMHAEDIGFAGPGKSLEELEAACLAGIGSLNAESVQELERANQVAGKLGRRFNVALRINPAYDMVASGMRMGGGPKPFGIDEEDIPGALQRFAEWSHLDFVGFHIFAGAQNLNPEFIVSALTQAFAVLENLLPHCPVPPRMINLGGGFGIPYFANDTELDIRVVGETFARLLLAKRPMFKETQFVVETGRYLIGEAGVYIAKVLYRKQSRGETFLVLNGGMNHQLAASGNLGQVIKKPYPMVIVDKVTEKDLEPVNIVGPLCTPIDSFGKKIALPHAEVGDLVAVFCSGAYGYSSSPLGFLSHRPPEEKVLC